MEAIVFSRAHELAEAIGRRDVSAAEVLEAHLDHIKRHNLRLNAVVTLDEETARQQAKEADQALADGQRWGPLHGVPVTIKDALETAGLRTTAGFPPLADYLPTTDATVVARLRAAGAVVVGKTNLPTMALGAHCDNPVFGRTDNPWDPSRVPGGSSGGPAAAVAAGLSALDVGSDLAGSLRLPAHYCGVCALKPTEHRVPKSGHVPEPPGVPRGVRHMATLGPVARSVDDLALALGLLAGPDGREWEVPPVPVEPVSPPALDGLHLAWTDDFAGLPVTADTRQALRRLAGDLEARGCRIEQASPDGFDLTEIWETWGELAMAEIGATMPDAEKQQFLADFASDPDDPPARRQAGAADATVAQYTQALHRRDGFVDALERFLESVDAWLCPVSPTPAVPHHEPGTAVSVDGEHVPYLLGTFGHCIPFNVTGSPAVTIPMAFSREGLPIGCQLVGRRWDDSRLLALAKAVTEVAGPFEQPPASAPH